MVISCFFAASCFVYFVILWRHTFRRSVPFFVCWLYIYMYVYIEMYYVTLPQSVGEGKFFGSYH